jgi:antitoxin CcdA
MKNYRSYQFTSTAKVLTSITCDICKKEYPEFDVLEIQEFHHIDFVGGYASVFGDGYRVKCDICQHCLQKMIGENLQ